MIHINNRSDFSIIWKMPNGGILPSFPYTLEFSTRGGLRYAVKSDDESRFIPKPDENGQVRSAVIVFDFHNRPHLPSGRLLFTMKAAIPSGIYPDGYQGITDPHPTNIELWDGASDYKYAVEIDFLLPYVKGDKGDAGEGVPAGGSKGQVLKKRSNADFDTAWGEDEGITDIAPNAVGTKELAANSVTFPKLSPEVRAILEKAGRELPGIDLSTWEELDDVNFQTTISDELFEALQDAPAVKFTDGSETIVIAYKTVSADAEMVFTTPIFNVEGFGSSYYTVKINQAPTKSEFLFVNDATATDDYPRFSIEDWTPAEDGSIRGMISDEVFEAMQKSPIAAMQADAHGENIVLYKFNGLNDGTQEGLVFSSLVFGDGDGLLFNYQLIANKAPQETVLSYVVISNAIQPDAVGKFMGVSEDGIVAPTDYTPDSFRKTADKIGADDVADKAVGLPKLSTEVQEKLDAGASSLRYDAVQELTTAQKEQLAENEGVPTVFMQTSALGSTLSKERGSAVANAGRIVCIDSAGKVSILLKGYEDSTSIYFYGQYTESSIRQLSFNKSTRAISYLASVNISDKNAVKITAQTLTSAQQSQARANISAMANTPSGDPMHYMYEAAGAEWIPYANISTTGLQEWQIDTLDREQAQADGGVWWHNDIFVSVEQNRINYIYTIGSLPGFKPSYLYFLNGLPITTNYMQNTSVEYSAIYGLDHCICNCPNLVSVRVPTMTVGEIKSTIYNCPKLCIINRALAVSNVETITDSFIDVPELRRISLYHLNTNINLSGVPKFNNESFNYLLNSIDTTTTIVVTLHPEAYARAMANAEIVAKLESLPNVTFVDAGGNFGGAN